MSKTFDIACPQCRKKLWIAQEGTSRNLYAAEGAIAALRDFLFDHAGHPLVFDECTKLFDSLGELKDVTPADRDEKLRVLESIRQRALNEAKRGMADSRAESAHEADVLAACIEDVKQLGRE